MSFQKRDAFGGGRNAGRKKPTSKSKHPSSCTKSGKIELEAYGKEMAEWNLHGHDHR